MNTQDPNQQPEPGKVENALRSIHEMTQGVSTSGPERAMALARHWANWQGVLTLWATDGNLNPKAKLNPNMVRSWDDALEDLTARGDSTELTQPLMGPEQARPLSVDVARHIGAEIATQLCDWLSATSAERQLRRLGGEPDSEEERLLKIIDEIISAAENAWDAGRLLDPDSERPGLESTGTRILTALLSPIRTALRASMSWDDVHSSMQRRPGGPIATSIWALSTAEELRAILSATTDRAWAEVAARLSPAPTRVTGPKPPERPLNQWAAIGLQEPIQWLGATQVEGGWTVTLPTGVWLVSANLEALHHELQDALQGVANFKVSSLSFLMRAALDPDSDPAQERWIQETHRWLMESM